LILFKKRLEESNSIYKSHYDGWYSVTDETFVPTSQVTDRKLPTGELVKISSETGKTVQWTSETNYLFKLSKFQHEVRNWILTGK
jgi:methionyl-tRNA synthetase